MPQALSHLIADKVMRRALPSDRPIKVRAARGTDHRCDACEKPITTRDVEFELALPGEVILRFHLACENSWRAATGNDRARR
jgi:hypothetical protein